MKFVRFAVVAVLMLGATFSLAGCGEKDVAAKVNGEVITLTELNEQVEMLKQNYPQLFQGADGEARLLQYKQQILDNLINQKLVAIAAKDKGVEVSDDEIAKQLDQLKQGFKTDEEWNKALKQYGMTAEQLEQQIRDQLLQQKLIDELAKDVKVTDKEIKDYYEKNKKLYYLQPAKRASHILFKPEDKATAEKVLKQVKAGGNFAALAKKYSTDPGSKEQGGDLGWPTTPYVPEFEAALGKLGKGEISGLVKTQFGWHIIKVTDQRAGKQQALDEVKDQIRNVLEQQKRADAYQKYIDALRKKATIEIVAEELKADKAPTSATASAPAGK